MSTLDEINAIRPRIVVEYGEPLFEHQRNRYVIEDTNMLPSGMPIVLFFGPVCMVVFDVTIGDGSTII